MTTDQALQLSYIINDMHGLTKQLGDTSERGLLESIVDMLNLIDDAKRLELTDPARNIAERADLIQHYAQRLAFLFDGLVPIKSQNEWKSELKRISLNPIVDGNEMWVPQWVANALQVYQDQDGFAGMPLYKFLNKMKPVDENGKQLPTGSSSQKNFRRKYKNR